MVRVIRDCAVGKGQPPSSHSIEEKAAKGIGIEQRGRQALPP